MGQLCCLEVEKFAARWRCPTMWRLLWVGGSDSVSEMQRRPTGRENLEMMFFFFIPIYIYILYTYIYYILNMVQKMFICVYMQKNYCIVLFSFFSRMLQEKGFSSNTGPCHYCSKLYMFQAFKGVLQKILGMFVFFSDMYFFKKPQILISLDPKLVRPF